MTQLILNRKQTVSKRSNFAQSTAAQLTVCSRGLVQQSAVWGRQWNNWIWTTINHQLVFTKSGVVGWGTTRSIAEVKKVDPPWRIHQKCFTNYLFSLKRSQENWTMLLLMSKIDLKSLSEIKLVFWKRFLSGETENARGSKRERQRESKEKVSNTQQIQKTVLT